MSPAAFLDANVVVYSAGRSHALQRPSASILDFAAQHPRSFVTDAEVLQELLHRFLALRMWPDARGTFTDFSELMRGRIEPLYAEDVERAADLAGQHPHLSARDLVHIAVMERLGVTAIVSADRDFDAPPGIRRLDPADVESWRAEIEAAS